jgi:hypothetical protein
MSDHGWSREPYAVIEEVGTSWFGRRRWLVYIRHGVIQYGPDGYGWHVVGTRERAEAKARLYLARYRERMAPRPQTVIR